MENKVVNLQVNDNIDETTKSVVSLKTQLRQAQQEVAALSDKFGATSKEAVEAAKQAAILKDKIGDAKALTDAFNPDAKFNALSSSLGGVASGFAAYQGAMGLVGVESKDLEQQLLKVQSAMAIAQGLQGLGEARDSFKQLKAVGVNAFNAIKTAIGGTGIGLIVIAAGAIYAYWDDIKETVSSVSAEQKKLNELSKINLDTEEKKLSAIGSQDNVLKLQGKTEKDILKIKIAQTDQVIKASEIQIQQSIATSKAQTEAAIRNQEILSGILKFISIPLTLVLKTVDAVGKALGKDFGLESAVFKGVSSFVFDPIKTKKEGEAVVAEQRKALEKLKNDRAGLQLSINSIDKQANEAAKTEIDKKAATQAEADKKALEEKKRILQEEKDFMLLLDDAAREKRVNDALEKEAADAKVLEDATAMVDALDAEAQRKEDNEKKRSEDSIKNAQAEAEAKRNINNIAIQSAQGLVGILASLGEKNKGIQRAALLANSALSIAEIINNTNVGSSKEVATKGIFGLSTSAVLYAKMAISIGSVIAATAKGLKGLGGGGAVSAGGTSNRGAADNQSSNVTAAVAPTFNVVGTSGQNQIAQSLGNQAPVKAYVVANDVSSQQSLDRNIVKTATLGN
jgi:hypothetical protein